MPGEGRRGIVAGGIIALVLVAFGVFVLPFAFTTPPPIITRFVATRAFSPGNEAGRPIATVAIRLSEPSNVAITVKDPETGAIVARLADGDDVVRARTRAVTWDGRDVDGRQVPDGTYAIDLAARAGDKKFSKSRKIVVDTTAPQPTVEVSSTATACVATVSAPGEVTTVTFSAPTAGVVEKPRRVGARASTTWTWGGRGDDGALVPPGISTIRVAMRDERGNQAVAARTCWVSHLSARAVPGNPAPGAQVGATVPGGPGTEVTLSLRRRVGAPGGPVGRQVVGEEVAVAVTGPAGSARITLPVRIPPRALWLLVATGPNRQALVGLGDR